MTALGWFFFALRAAALGLALLAVMTTASSGRARRGILRLPGLLGRLAWTSFLWGAWRVASAMERGGRSVAESIVCHLDRGELARERHRRAVALVDAVRALADVSRGGVNGMQIRFELRGEVSEGFVGWRPRASPRASPKSPARCNDRPPPARETLN